MNIKVLNRLFHLTFRPTAKIPFRGMGVGRAVMQADGIWRKWRRGRFLLA